MVIGEREESMHAYTLIKTRKQVMDHVRGGIRTMKRSFFVHTQAEGKSPEIFETTDQLKNELTTFSEEAQNEEISQNKSISESLY